MLGKFFGAALGFIFGGPFGALLGTAVGHNFDRNALKPGMRQGIFSYPNSVRDLFSRTAFQLIGYIAKADGRVSESEIATAKNIMDRLQLNASQRRTAIECFTAGKQPNFSLEATLKNFQKINRLNNNLLQQLLKIQLEVAYSDGNLHPATYARLLSVSRKLGVPKLEFERFHNLFLRYDYLTRGKHRDRDYCSAAGPYHQGGQRQSTNNSNIEAKANSLYEAYNILGLSRDVSNGEIKLAYRRLLNRNHPDKLASNGASPSDINRATEQTRKITTAYECIRTTRRFL